MISHAIYILTLFPCNPPRVSFPLPREGLGVGLLMLLQISTSALAEALTAVSKAMSAKNPIAILDDALLSCENGKYYITGGSTDASLRMPIEVNLMKGNFEPIMLPLNLLNSSLALMPDVPVVFDVTTVADGYSVKCEYQGKGEQKGRFSFTTQSGKDYPQPVVPEEVKVSFVTTPANLLAPLTAAADFTHKKLDSSPMYNVAICVNCEGYDVVATDGHKLYRYTHQAGVGFATGEGVAVSPDGKLAHHDILILPQVVGAITHAFRKEENICVTANDQKIIFSANGIRLTLSAREGKYPNYNGVIPKANQYSVTLNRKETMEALKRVNVFASVTTNLIILSANGLLINIAGQDVDYSRASSEDICVINTNLPSGYKIGLNVQMLMRLVANVTTENVRLLLDDPTRPVLIKDDDDNANVTMLTMPMIVEN